MDEKYTVHRLKKIEYIKCEHWRKDRSMEPQKTFIMKADECTVHPSLPSFGGSKISLGAVKITQFGVNSNIATTGHKLQGMTKNKLVVSSWMYLVRNWVYVVLSCVQTLDGLYLFKT